MTNIHRMRQLQERLDDVEPWSTTTGRSGERIRNNQATTGQTRVDCPLTLGQLRELLDDPVCIFNQGIGHGRAAGAGVGGMAAMAVQAERDEALRIRNRRLRRGDEPSLAGMASELLQLDAEQAAVLLFGPSDLGDCRAWITPGEAALALQKVLERKRPGQVWDHLDRTKLREQAEAYQGWVDHVLTWSEELGKHGQRPPASSGP